VRAAVALALALALSSGVAEAKRARRARSKPAPTVKRPSGDLAGEAARADAQIAELKQMRELPATADANELDFPGQQVDDAERPPSTPAPRRR